jgi:hypothetical protein
MKVDGTPALGAGDPDRASTITPKEETFKC